MSILLICFVSVALLCFVSVCSYVIVLFIVVIGYWCFLFILFHVTLLLYFTSLTCVSLHETSMIVHLIYVVDISLYYRHLCVGSLALLA